VRRVLHQRVIAGVLVLVLRPKGTLIPRIAQT
jgi:hypothetical protein